jgi:hypothetical protein
LAGIFGMAALKIMPLHTPCQNGRQRQVIFDYQ